MLAPGSTIGILGGGQLGRMLGHAGTALGFHVHIYAPDAELPAAEAATHVTRGAYEDAAALTAFAAAVDVVTYEFENVPASAAALLNGLKPVRPGVKALDVAQDRLTEKDFLRSLGLHTAPYAAADSGATAEAAFAALGGREAIVKTRRLGYDGKGQVRARNAAEAAAALRDLKAPCILEGVVPFAGELSVVAARGLDGTIAAFDAAANVHREGILRTSRVPAQVNTAVGAEAGRIAGVILEALDYVGVIGVELFLAVGGALLVNEIAPRVHNTGHWTMDACAASQFEQHMRAVAGWPLKPAARWADCEMENLIGDDVLNWRAIAAEPNACLHLYGKSEVRAGRKMGHVNRLYPLGGLP
ncbi:MAG: 5-(carboxyamino)imidazole ribonucleotide synthase [Alphaproteobacteria bacterium]|nr:5-(carboxyamino)imidazole ribonucleotide synthase [Alphaproteobacteria bacterium]